MRRLRNLPGLLWGALMLLGMAKPALAEVVCVDTAVGLQNALTTAASNAQDNEVQIVQGTYVGNFFYASTQANRLSVLGGTRWVAPVARSIRPIPSWMGIRPIPYWRFRRRMWPLSSWWKG